jgi:hypothetical protein
VPGIKVFPSNTMLWNLRSLVSRNECFGADGEDDTRERMETSGDGSRFRRVLIRRESLGPMDTRSSSMGMSFTSISTEKAERVEARRRLIQINFIVAAIFFGSFFFQIQFSTNSLPNLYNS